MSRVTELQRKLRESVGAADAIREKYKNTDGNMTDDEAAAFDGHMDEADKLTKDITREQRAEKMSKLVDDDPAPDPVPHPTPGAKGAQGDDPRETVERKQFRAWIKSGNIGATLEALRAAKADAKALQADDDLAGGYIVAPQTFVTELIQAVDDQVWMRGLATVRTLDRSESLGVPTLDTDLTDPDWTSEIATGSEDTVKPFGKRELRPHPLAKRIKISRKLLRQAAIDPERLVMERLAYKFGLAEEKAFLTGSGAQQPLGVFTASADGIPTSRDVVAGSTTAITADGLIDVKHTAKAQYWARGRWLFHRDAIKMIRKLKDSQNQYIWAPVTQGIQSGAPGEILDSPYMISEYVPNTFTTGLYVGLFGDFSFYWIADALDMEVQRVDQLYAEQNQMGYIGRKETDGMPVLAEAFVRAKLA